MKQGALECYKSFRDYDYDAAWKAVFESLNAPLENPPTDQMEEMMWDVLFDHYAYGSKRMWSNQSRLLDENWRAAAEVAADEIGVVVRVCLVFADAAPAAFEKDACVLRTFCPYQDVADVHDDRPEDVAEAVDAATQEAMDSARAADYSALDSFGVMISKKEMTGDEESAFHELTKAVTDRYDASKKTVDDLYAEVSAVDPATYGSYYTDAYKTDVTSNMDTYTDAYNKGKYQNAYDALTTVKALYAAAEGDQNRAKERSETYAAKAEAQPAPAASAPAPAPAPAHNAGYEAAARIGEPWPMDSGMYGASDTAGNFYMFDANGNQIGFSPADAPSAVSFN